MRYEELLYMIPEIEMMRSSGERIVDRKHSGIIDDPIQALFVDYNKLLDHCICAFEPYMDHSYIEKLDRYRIEDPWKLTEDDLSRLPEECIIALITAAIRSERFCDGSLKQYFDSGCIAAWLKRFRKLSES